MLEPVRLTEHLQNTRESENKRQDSCFAPHGTSPPPLVFGRLAILETIFVILGAPLVFESRFSCFFQIGNLAFLDCNPVSPISTLFRTFLLISTTSTLF